MVCPTEGAKGRGKMEKLIVSAHEARELLGTSTTEVARLLNTGEICAFKRGKKWCIPVEELKRYVIETARKDTERRINEDKRKERTPHGDAL